MGFNPHAHLENPELSKEKQEPNKVTPDDLNKTKEGAKKIFGTFKPKEYDPNKVILDTELPDMSDTGIENIPENEDDKEIKKQLSEKGKNSKNFINDIGEFKKINGLENIDFDIEGEEFEAEVLNKIGGNYIKTKLENGENDFEVDLKKSINETKEEILKNVKNIPDSVTYDVAIDNIEKDDIKKQLEGIESLYALAYSKEGELGKTTLDKYKNKRKKKLIDEYKKLDKEFNELESKETTEEINKRKKEINERITEIGDEANEIEAGDIFEASELETVTGKKED